MAKGKRKEKRFLAFLCILTILITTIIPTNITYAATSQYEEVEGDVTSENESVSTEVEPADEESQEGCVLDDGLSIFDTYAQNVPFVAAYEECTPHEKKVVNEVVVFISFSDLG